MMENITLRFRNRWQLLLVVLILLLAFSPTPLPNSWVGSLDRAVLALQSGDLTSALEDIESSIATEPALASLHFFASDLAIFLGDHGRSADHLTMLEPGFLEPAERFCHSTRIDSYERVVSDPDSSWERWVSECPYALQQAKDVWLESFSTYPNANQLPYFRILHEIDPEDVEIHMAYAQLLSIENPEEALDHLRELSNRPDGTHALERDILRMIGASEVDEASAFRLAQIGQVFARYQRWSMARLAFQAAVLEEPGYNEAHAYLGLAKEQTGQDGYDEISSAIGAAPNSPLPYVFLAIHHQKRGQIDLASQALDSAARLDPENPAIAAQLGSVYAELGDFSSATQAYLAATDLSPDDDRFWLLLAGFSLEYDLDLVGIGLPAARNAVSVASDKTQAYEMLGKIQLELGKYSLAERSLREALSLEPLSPSVQYSYGLLMQLTAQPDVARAAFLAASLIDSEGRYGVLAARFLQ